MKCFVILGVANVALAACLSGAPASAPTAAPIPVKATNSVKATNAASVASKPSTAANNVPPPKASLIEIKKKAEEGDVKAQIALAEEFTHMQKYKLAEQWYSTAALKGNREALYALADMYMTPHGSGPDAVKLNLTNGMILHRLAAAQGYAPSHFQLGIAYKDGNTAVRKNALRAYFHLKLSEANSKRETLLNQLVAEMPRDQIEAAEKMVTDFRSVDFDSAFAELVFESVRITGIYGGGEKRIAMINGKQINEGQQVNILVGGLTANVKLDEIRSDSVFVSYRSLERKITPQRL
jgi:hypothetical protein